MKYLFFTIFAVALFAEDKTKENIVTGTEEAADYRLSVEQPLEIALDGQLWIYLEEKNENINLAAIKVERQLHADETVFKLSFQEPNFYRLRFFRQDTPSDTVEERFLTFRVETAKELAQLSPSATKLEEEQSTTIKQQDTSVNITAQRQPTDSFLEPLLEKIEQEGMSTVAKILEFLREEIKKRNLTLKEQQHIFETAEMYETGSKQNLSLALALYRSYSEHSNNLVEKQKALYRIYLLQRDFVYIN